MKWHHKTSVDSEIRSGSFKYLISDINFVWQTDNHSFRQCWRIQRRCSDHPEWFLCDNSWKYWVLRQSKNWERHVSARKRETQAGCDVSFVMNHPATRDPLGSRSPGCCYHPWNPQVYPPCGICSRAVLTLQQQCPLRAGLVGQSSMHHPLHRHPYFGSQTPLPVVTGPVGTPCHDHHHHYHHYHQHQQQHQQSRSAETTPTPFNRFEWRSSSVTTSTNPRYHTHPPPRSTASRSPPIARHYQHHHDRHHGSQDDSSIGTGQRAASSSYLTRPLIPPALEPTHRWIGEETKRSLPSHVYKYYLAHTKEYRRQSRKVIIFLVQEKRVWCLLSPRHRVMAKACSAKNYLFQHYWYDRVFYVATVALY